MSLTHLHLLLNHYPIIGTIIGIALLMFAHLRKSNDVAKVALGLFAVLGAISVVVYLTGESAEHAIENLPGFSEPITESHEEFALFATIVLAAFGAVSALALVVFRRVALPRMVTLGCLAVSVVAGGMMGYTGLTGGQIRHTELRSGNSAQAIERESD